MVITLTSWLQCFSASDDRGRKILRLSCDAFATVMCLFIQIQIHLLFYFMNSTINRALDVSTLPLNSLLLEESTTNLSQRCTMTTISALQEKIFGLDKLLEDINKTQSHRTNARCSRTLTLHHPFVAPQAFGFFHIMRLICVAVEMDAEKTSLLKLFCLNILLLFVQML